MSKQQHTPGPWLIAGEDKSFVYALGPKGTNSFWACVQSAGAERIDQSEKEANARLIAAAPELLAALVEMVDRFDDFRDRDNLPQSELSKRARAAISKATGA